MKDDAIALDMCCGSKMFYADKNDPNVLFGDKRKESHILCDGRVLNIDPDVILDFTNLPFEDNSFKVVVFDPPHMKSLGEKSWMALKYGRLTEGWQKYLAKGFDEGMRVLDMHGVFIFKWNEHDIKVSEILSLIPYRPTITQRTGKHNKTIWMMFIKYNPTP